MNSAPGPRLASLGILFLFALLPAIAHSQALPQALQQWMDYEQNYLERTVDTSKIKAPSVGKQQVAYRPETGKWFDIKSAWVPENELNVAEAEKMIPAELRPELIKTVDGKRYFRLFVHPESESFYAKFLTKYPLETAYEATATASSRTLLVRAKNNPARLFFAKVSLNVELGGVTRTILRDESARGIGTAMYLNDATKSLDSGFAFVPEVLGIIPKGWSEGGQIIRLIPPEVMTGQSTLMPLFSLYSKKPDGTMLEKLAKKVGLSPVYFAKQYIVDPFSKTWADWAVHGPVTMEAHAQNVLIELGPDGLPTKRFFMRDLGGFEIDSSAPGFNPERLRHAPVFKSFEADYFPKSAAQMQTQSLSTYFEGGFLFNIDKELARTQPGYVAGTINQVFWDRIGNELAAASGLPRALFTRKALEESMPVMVRLGEFHAAHPTATLEQTIRGALSDAPGAVKLAGGAWLKSMSEVKVQPPELLTVADFKTLAKEASRTRGLSAPRMVAEGEAELAEESAGVGGRLAPSGTGSALNCIRNAVIAKVLKIATPFGRAP